MYPDKFPSKPTDYYDIDEDGNVVPPGQSGDVEDEEYLDVEDEIKNAVERQVGQIAVQTEDMSDEERLRKMREEREDDRRGTHPGTSRELTPEEREAGKRLAKERLKEIKKQKKIDKAINIISRINPNTRDSSLARELSIARAYLLKNNLNPDDYLPDHWKNS